MPSYQKKHTGWRVEICCRNQRRSRTFPTKAECRAWAERTERAIRAGKSQDTTNLLLTDLLDRYAKEVSPQHKGARWESIRIRMLQRHQIALVPLSKLDATHISSYRDDRLKSVKSSSVNRELNLLSAALNTARIEWKLIDTNPCTNIRRPKNPPPRNRRISDTEIDLIVAQLGGSKDVRDMFLLALESGMRLGEMCGIKQADIQSRYVTLRDTKNGTDRHVPLSSRARELIRVFNTRSATASALFTRAVRKAGIEGLTFHDSRHEATFRLAQKIKNPLDLAKITGHRDLKVLLNVYYSPTADDLALLLE